MNRDIHGKCRLASVDFKPCIMISRQIYFTLELVWFSYDVLLLSLNCLKKARQIRTSFWTGNPFVIFVVNTKQARIKYYISSHKFI